MNNDDRLDIVTVGTRESDEQGTLSVLLGLGDGNFAGLPAWPIGDRPITVAVDDLNRDGAPDVIVGNGNGGAISVALGRGDGTVSRPVLYGVYSYGWYPSDLALGDLNADGALDVISANWLSSSNYSGAVTVALGRTFAVRHARGGIVAAPVSSIMLSFRDEMIPSTFSTEDDVAFAGPEGPLNVERSEWPDSHTLRLDFTPQTAVGFYQMTVGPDILNTAGDPMDVDRDQDPGEVLDDQYTARFAVGGPQILGHSWSGSFGGPVESVRLAFDHPMDEDSFAIDPDVEFQGPDGPIQVTGHRWIDSQNLELLFADQAALGQYHFRLGPDISDQAGNALDQDGDFVVGESPDDEFHLDFYLADFVTYSGTLTEDTRWRGCILVDGPLLVPENVTLTVEEGTVVKVTDSFEVQGSLHVNGTVEAPVQFTSVADDSVCGDINGDGDSTSPIAGDWTGIRFSGPSAKGFFDHAEIRYADTAIHGAAEGARVEIDNGVLTDGNFGVYVYTPYVEIAGNNCLIADNQRNGIFVRADSREVFRNCTIVGNGFGVGPYGAGVHLGGANLTLENCILAFNRTGLEHSGDPPELTVRHSNFHNPDGDEIIWAGGTGEPQLDQNGNFVGDPKFVDRAAGNYELAAGSPAIDSANGNRAPATDILGRARFDDVGMPNVGAGVPVFVDMGAFERKSSTAAPDLSVVHVASPDPRIITAGESTTIEWTVRNVGTLPCNGTWQDVVYLSDDPYIGPNDLALDPPNDHTGSLAPGESYTASLTPTISGISGPKYVLVRTNVNRDVPEAVDANNVAVAPEVLAVDVPLLETGVQMSGTASVGQWEYHRYEAQPGRTVLFSLDGDAGSWELYVRRELPPSVSFYDTASRVPGQNYQETRLLDPADTTYYVGLVPRQHPNAAGQYTLSAHLTMLDIRQVTPNIVGNAGNATFQIVGDEFYPETQVELVALDGATFEAEEYFQDSTTLFATFELAGVGAAPGLYDILVTSPGLESVVDHGAVTVLQGGDASFQANVVVPGQARPGRVVIARIDFTNSSSIDIYSPLVHLESSVQGAQWQLPGQDEWITGPHLDVVALSSEGAAGVLRPQQAESISVKLRMPFTTQSVPITLEVVTAANMQWEDPIDWSVVQGEPGPFVDHPQVWQDFWDGMSTDLGSTWGSLATALAKHATVISAYGMREYVVRALMADFVTKTLYDLSSKSTSVRTEDLGAASSVKEPRFSDDSQTTPTPTIKCINRIEPDSNKPTVYVLHGIDSDPNSGSIAGLVDTLRILDTVGELDANIVTVDWHEFSDTKVMGIPGVRYNQACRNTEIVGEFMANWHKENGLYQSDTIVMAHSLGAHLGGEFGEHLIQMALPRPTTIFSIDGSILTDHLDRFDANTVIHLHGSLLGSIHRLGDTNIHIAFDRPLAGENHGEMVSVFANWILANPSIILKGAIPDALEGTDWQAFNTLGIRLTISREELMELLRKTDVNSLWQDEWLSEEIPWDEWDSHSVRLYTSFTPEDKFGPAGWDPMPTPVGSDQRLVSGSDTLEYRIEFWNKEDAPVPTQDAIIVDTLDPDVFDLSTLELTRIGFLKWDVLLDGGQVIDTRIDLRPDMNLAVEVKAGLGMEIPGFVHNDKIADDTFVWWFHCIDPMTGDWPEDPMAGFLPPFNPQTGYEIGWVEFSVDHVKALPSGTRIENQAFVEFDFAGDLPEHPAPKEAPWVNTIDAGIPEDASRVGPLSETVHTPSFLVSWAGEDEPNGSGIGSYDIYVSTDGGPFVLWLDDTEATAAVFTGENGRTYGFKSRSKDNVGHVEPDPLGADVTTTVDVTAAPENSSLIVREGAFLVDQGTGRKWFYAGTNNYYMGVDNTSTAIVDELISDMIEMQLNVVRLWAFNDDQSKDTKLQGPDAGMFEPVNFEMLDYVLAKANENNIRVILPLTNYWPDYGGMEQYMRWAGADPPGGG
jgi:hypothetical protein